MSHSGCIVAHCEAQIDILVNTWLIVYLVLGCGFQCSDQFLRLGIALVSILAGELEQLERLTHALHYQSGIVETHHDQAPHLSIGLRGHTDLGGYSKLVSRCLLQQHVGHLPEILPSLRKLISI